MPDTGSNIIIDITGNTANMATDFASTGSGITNAHVPVQKIAFGDSTITKRVSSSDPLPITIQSYQTNVGVTGEVGITGMIEIVNPFETAPTGITNNWIKVAGNVTGGDIGITGTIQGISGGVPVGITGTVSISESTGMPIHGISGADGKGGTLAPVFVTGGRGLTHGTDSVTVHGTVGITGGRTILAATDSIKVFGSDATEYIPNILYRSRDGATAGFSGDALKVSIVDQTINATVNVSSTHGVTNDVLNNALRVQGLTGGEPLLIKGENGGAVPITASTAVPTSISGTVTISDTNIVNALETATKPVPQNLISIKNNTQPISGIRSDLNSGNVKVQVLETSQPSSIASGTKTATATASQIAANQSTKVGVKVKASIENTDSVLIGDYQLTRNESSGYPLEPGESCFLNVNNIGLLYCRSLSGNQQLHYLGS
jgi:hypothetical protein